MEKLSLEDKMYEIADKAKKGILIVDNMMDAYGLNCVDLSDVEKLLVGDNYINIATIMNLATDILYDIQKLAEGE